MQKKIYRWKILSINLAMVRHLKKQYDFMTDYGRFELFLGYLTRTFHGEVIPEATRFDTNDASNILQTEYHIECLKHINGNEMVYFDHFNVNFEKQVWPVNFFESVEPYRCTRERVRLIDPWDDEVSLHVAKYFRRPVMVLFVRYNIIDELKKSYVDVADIYKIFITLYQEYERQSPKEWSFPNPGRFNISCMTLPKGTKHSKELTVNFLKVLVSLGDITHDTRLLINQCNKCNWLPYSQILCNLFKEITSFPRAEKYLNYFIDERGDIGDDRATVSNKPMVLQSVLKVILDKHKRRHGNDFSIFFRSVWNLAKKVGREYGKSQIIKNIVPFLIELVEDDVKNKSDVTWLDTANHFLKIMESHNAKNLELKERDSEMLEKLRSICSI